MELLQTGGLIFAFAAVADLALTGGVNISSAYNFALEQSAEFANAFDASQTETVSTTVQEIASPAVSADPCLSAGGHYHGTTCHYPGGAPVSPEPVIKDGVMKLG